MATRNIFAGFGVRSEFVNLIYTELMKRDFVSYADVLALYCGRPKGYYNKMACNSEPGYGEQNFTNIDLLPVFYKAITNKQVLSFDYQPFGQELFTLTFHPQFIKEYNGRWFVFGDANREPYQAYNVPLDRIVSEVNEVSDVEYIPAPKGFYHEFFNNIIGVTHEKGAKVEEVIIRTKTEYQHGLLLTKPLHHSQKGDSQKANAAIF